MSIEWVNRAIDGLRVWGHENGVTPDADEVRLLCDYASDYLEVAAPGDFRPATFEELLLEIYPRKVITPPDSAPGTVAAAHSLVDFLAATGEVDGPTAAEMRATLDRVGPLMPAALADSSKFGMAKSIFSVIGADTFELIEPGVDDAAPRLGQGRSLTLDEDCDCPGCAPLPPVRLAAPGEVATMVREVPLLRDAHTVVAWMVGNGATATTRKALRVKDARELAGQGVARPSVAWGLALELGLAELDGVRVSAEAGFRALEERADEDVLDLWVGLVEFLGEDRGEVTGSAVVDKEVYAIHDLLYRLQVPVPVEAVGDYLSEVADDGPVGDLTEALEGLVAAGTVAITDEGLVLTPHGMWGIREMYAELGLDAPIAPDLAEGDASGLIAGLLSDGVTPEAAEPDIVRWLGARSPAEAAGELLEAVVGAPAEVRGVAVTIVDRLGFEAEPAVRRYLSDPELRPHVIHWLSARRLGAPPLTEDEMLWVSVDMLALAIPAAEADPESFAENMAASGPSPEVIEDMWKVEHPDVVQVLELLGHTLPDRNAAKAARKAAFKARSRGIR
ncbi:hypothetical protein [Herbidospora yilanensis]|uniref:hypothetical protein n=1 Tax=Herbidospora yilanensis TaxID=354426 RepID=UPI00078262FF|nr:hypothetical protein [Herbidospora yilanensis]